VDGLVGQPACRLIRLFATGRGEGWIGLAVVEFDAFRQTVSHQNQFHLSGRPMKARTLARRAISTRRERWGSVPE
jgi:hypothetical protein